MSDEKRTREQLINELNELRRRVSLLEKKEKNYRLMEDSLRASEERYRALFVNNPVDTIIVDDQARVVEFNQAKKWFGGRLPEIGDVMYRDYAGKHDIPMHEELLDCIRTGVMKRFPEQKYGNRYLHIRMAPFPGGAIITSIDITERKRVEEALRKSEEKHRLLLGNVDEIIYSVDVRNDPLEGQLQFVSDQIEKVIGYRADELIRNPRLWLRLVHPEDREQLAQDTESLIREGRKGDRFYRLQHKESGEYRRLEDRVVPQIDEHGRVIGFFGMARDVTEQKMAEEALQETEERFRELSDLLPQIIFEMDDKGRLVFVNQIAFKSTGYTEKDLSRGLSALDMIIPEDRERAGKNIESIMNERAYKGGNEYTALRKDGSTFPVIVYSSPVVREDKYVGIRGVIVDITGQKRAEAELIRAEKLESIGLLAGGIAHDFNNMLTAILGNISLARTYLDPQEAVHERLREVEKAAQRAQGLTRQLLTFTKGGRPIKKTVQVAEFIEEASSFALRGSNVRRETALAPDLWPAEIDTGQFSQVIQNLAINAGQAMPAGGILKISARNIEIGEDNLLPLAAGRYIKISLADQGEGIYKKDLAKIFDPYFSTKEGGSGLGLAVAYSIIKNHKGHISVESKRRSGTRFDIYLPGSGAEPDRLEKTEEKLATGSGKILVMDDEKPVREVAAKILSSAGYRTELAAGGQEALELYRKARKAGEPFAAVVMDLTVPGGMGGVETLEKLLKIDPGVKALVSSGYANDPIMADYRQYGFCGVVPKPYTFNELCSAVSRVISDGYC